MIDTHREIGIRVRDVLQAPMTSGSNFDVVINSDEK